MKPKTTTIRNLLIGSCCAVVLLVTAGLFSFSNLLASIEWIETHHHYKSLLRHDGQNKHQTEHPLHPSRRQHHQQKILPPSLSSSIITLPSLSPNPMPPPPRIINHEGAGDTSNHQHTRHLDNESDNLHHQHHAHRSQWPSTPSLTMSSSALLSVLNHTGSFEDEQDDALFCKVQSKNCYSYRCYAPMNYSAGGCLPNPYYKKSFLRNSTTKSTKSKSLYLDCPNRKDERKVLEQEPPSSTATTDRLHRTPASLHDFKKKTSWMFPKWFEWTGKCARNKPNQEGSGNHHDSDGLYRFQNVCIKPGGGPWATFIPRPKRFKRMFSEFHGGDDVTHATKDLESPMRHFIRNMRESIQVHHKPASCYLDTKLLLFPIDKRLDNIGHAYYRSHSMLRVIEAAFGKDAMLQNESVTIMYFATDAEGIKIVREDKKRMSSFYELLGTSWFGVLGPQLFPRSKTLPNSRFLPFKDERIDNNEYTCFSEIVVWQNGYFGKNRAGSDTRMLYGGGPLVATSSSFTQVAKEKFPGSSTSFHMHGPRSVYDAETANTMDHHLRKCANLAPKRKMRKPSDPVKILFLARPQWRRFLLQPYMIGYIGGKVSALQKQQQHRPHHHQFGGSSTASNDNNNKLRSFLSRNYSFETVALESFTDFKEIVTTFSSADVVIGMYGSLLTFASLMMPPGSLIFEHNTEHYRFAEINGISYNPASEFGGASMISGIHHLLVADKKILQRFTHSVKSPGAIDLLAPPRAFVDFYFEKIECMMFPKVHSNVSPFVGIAEKFQHPISIENTMERLRPLSEGVRSDTPPEVLRNIVPLEDPSCFFDDVLYMQLVSKSFDDDGNFQETILQLGNIELAASEAAKPVSSSNRIRSMMKHRDVLARALKTFVDVHVSALQPEFRVLIVEPCEARFSTLAESRFLKMILMNVDVVWVAEHAAGRRACRAAKFRRTAEYKRNMMAKSNNLVVDSENFTDNAHHQRAQNNNNNNSTPDETALDGETLHPTDLASIIAKRRNAQTFSGYDGAQVKDSYLRYCEYPCETENRFDLVLTDCWSKEDCVVQHHDNALLLSRSFREDTSNNKESSSSSSDLPLVMPSATDILVATAYKGIETTVVGFLQNSNKNNDVPTLYSSSLIGGIYHLNSGDKDKKQQQPPLPPPTTRHQSKF